MKYVFLMLCIFLLTGCFSGSEAPEAVTVSPSEAADIVPVSQPPAPAVPAQPDPIGRLIASMSLEERVGQLFLARCDSSVAISDLQNYHLGGFVLFANDFSGQTPQSMSQTLAQYQEFAKIPLLIAVDEEGGTVTRVSRYPAFRDRPFPSGRDAFNEGGLDQLLAVEKEKCLLLKSIGINVNLGPVCDMASEPSAFMYQRSLGQSPTVTARCVSDIVLLMQEMQVGSTLKHFPGYGNNADTHTGIATDSRSLEELEQADLYPFRTGIQSGCSAVMVSHTIVQAMDPENPASLSPAVHRYLRETMGFEGVIMTDDLVMQAITDRYGAGEAAVLAVLSGNDLLCSTEYRLQYDAVLAAVLEGRIDIDTLNNAVRNVLEWKTALGLI